MHLDFLVSNLAYLEVEDLQLTEGLRCGDTVHGIDVAQSDLESNGISIMLLRTGVMVLCCAMYSFGTCCWGCIGGSGETEKDEAFGM